MNLPKRNVQIDKHLIYHESDRGAVLVGASLLEQVLEKLLRTLFSAIGNPAKAVVDPLFSGMGPLNTFSAKITVCHLLGLLDDDQLHDLGLLRKVRNEFAHTAQEVDFSDKVISDRMRELTYAGFIKDSIRRYSAPNAKSTKPSRIPDYLLHKKGYIKYGKSLFAWTVRFLLEDLEETIKNVEEHAGKMPRLATNTMAALIALSHTGRNTTGDP